MKTQQALCLHNILQVAELASLAQLLHPRSPTVRNPAPDSSVQTAELLPDCVRFSCCSPLASALQLLLAACVRASAAAPGADCAASASTAAPPLPPLPAAAPRLRPLHLLLAAGIRFSCCSRSRPLRLLLPDCVRFNCCSPITSASTAAPRLCLLDSSQCPAPKFSNILRGVRGSLKYEGRASL